MAPKIVCVVGPTACGKTTLGVLLAKKFGGEVVSADSMQIYRGMTIGTAAPTEEEMDGVPHHMIAVSDPAEQWSAARYAQEAVPIIDGILARGKLPILVGGTGLWIDAVVKGHGFAAGCAGGAVRRELEERLAAEGIGPLLEELRQLLAPALRQAGLYFGNPFRDTEKLLNALYPARRLGACGMTEADVELFVANIFQAKQRLLAASYASFTPADAAAIYRSRL